ncbi:YetF domain-containing protein [Alteribacillus sp. JSM 102045]|uniref:YetF domain-containing protein n=1 Tax=Alteribacillus sp. JSM 102045 TaxID=1562101 RepID=UPI0035C255FA
MQDFKVPPQSVRLPVTLVRDRKLIQKNLEEIKTNKQWLINQLRVQGADKIENVLFAEWLENDGLFVIPYEQISAKQKLY